MFRPMQIPVSQCLADLNRDGRMDVVMGNEFGVASRLNSSPRPGWTAVSISFPGVDELIDLI
jgi:hypothetical protein